MPVYLPACLSVHRSGMIDWACDEGIVIPRLAAGWAGRDCPSSFQGCYYDSKVIIKTSPSRVRLRSSMRCLVDGKYCIYDTGAESPTEEQYGGVAHGTCLGITTTSQPGETFPHRQAYRRRRKLPVTLARGSLCAPITSGHFDTHDSLCRNGHGVRCGDEAMVCV
ncbi:uncharacterized protein K489DRAFT_373754 [Dissoconium aciculare CBS 342.82]|uniref:Uncharacterized protein n=1 Tax=Dissoconium aciculare CBS 342.82 TaxID=1314786 RepID=A0A6J3LU48_9PEZI|nr:uncharacterized protein K489DRAFT_373754 [Dissoconium aciculare CBS 342.82]KAF1819310.1 hypothetical protein K489DRAFT_373754 [Dissoconium aciculare CBS 342.82]